MHLKKDFLKFSLALFCIVLPSGPAFGAGYTLTVSTTGSGIVSRNPTNSIYPSGATVTLTATPDAGWLFSSWTGDEVSSANPLNVLMTSNKNVVAHFDLIPRYSVTTSVNGSGTISLNPSGGPYLSNTVVSASATPSSGWVFLNWSGDATGTANPLNLTMNTNKTVTAVFAQIVSITVPPQNLSLGLGQSATFTVQAAGTAPLRYQWYFAGTALSGQTASVLSLPNVQSENEGVYGIVVTNLYGSSSNFALLTITNVCSGGNVVHSASEGELRSAIAIGGLVRCCFNGTVVLTNTIEITHDVILDAQDRNVTISGNDAVRLFNVRPGVTFSATNIAFVHGRQVGTNGASAGAQPPQPGQPAEGGAIYCNGGTLQLIQCLLATNSAVGGTGGTGNVLVAGAAGGVARGGGMFSTNGSVTIIGGRLFSNSAIGGGGGPEDPGLFIANGPSGDALGGAIYVTNGVLRVCDSIITSNLCYAPKGGAQAVGGGVAASSASTILTNTLICTNACQGQNAQFYGSRLPPTPGVGLGGGIAILGGEARLSLCRVEGNAALGGWYQRYSSAVSSFGGGIYNSGQMTTENTTIAGNKVSSGFGTYLACGGGVYNKGKIVLNGCSATLNQALGAAGSSLAYNQGTAGVPGLGGGIFSSSQMNATNCTISGNLALGGSAVGDSVNPGGPGIGGGLFGSNGVVWLENVTVANNAVATGAPSWSSVTNVSSFGANIAGTNGSITLFNSIIAYPGTNANVWGTLTDGGFNICSDGSANFQSGASYNLTDPLLLSMADNGGPTPTMALSPDSPAVDFGSAGGAPTTDQRGLARPMGLGVDIGAYELSGRLTPPQLSFSAQGSSSRALSFPAQANVFYLLESSDSLQAWEVLEVLGPFSQSTNVAYSIPVASQGCKFFRVTVR